MWENGKRNHQVARWNATNFFYNFGNIFVSYKMVSERDGEHGTFKNVTTQSPFPPL